VLGAAGFADFLVFGFTTAFLRYFSGVVPVIYVDGRIPREVRPPLGPTDYLGFMLFLGDDI